MISVMPRGWGAAQPRDIEILLTDTASHLDRLLRTPFDGAIVVKNAPPDDAVPRTIFRPLSSGPFVIQLTARDRRWAQYAFQFSHEFCHILSGYERLRGNPNNWFHETICEIGSVFTLRRMVERWPDRPPYSNWVDYAESLRDYVEKRISRQAAKLPESANLQTWLSSQEEGLRKDPYQQDRNSLVAYALLPIFEEFPTGWNAIGSLPNSSAKLAGLPRRLVFIN